MKNSTRLTLIVLVAHLGLISPSMQAVDLGAAAPSSDNIIYVSQYPNGDKPQGGTCPPSTWTGLNVGDGGGTICDNGAGDLLYTVTGTNSINNSRIIHKDAGAGEVQIEGRILNNYGGSVEANAAIGLGVRETTSSTSWVAQVKSLQSGGTNAVQFQYGAADAPTNVWCSASGTTRPIWGAITYYIPTTEVRAFTSTNGSTWDPCFTVVRNMSDVLGYYIGGSKSASVSLTATMEDFALLSEIDAYDENAGAGGPTLVEPIQNQTGTQGQAFSLNVTSNFSGETGFNAITGLPAGSALTFNTGTGILSGTPDADDVGSNTLTITATNGGGSTPSSFELTVSAVPGDTFNIASTTGTVNCGISGIGAGDVIVLLGDAPDNKRGPITFTNCNGTYSDLIVIRNDTSRNSALKIQRSTGGGAHVQITDSTNWDWTGLNKYTTAPSGVCGYDHLTNSVSQAACGFIVETLGGSDGFVVRVAGTSCMGTTNNPQRCFVRGISLDGNGIGNSGEGLSSTGMSVNDHNVHWEDHKGATAADDKWRENITFEYNHIKDVGNTGGGEGHYVGGNQPTGADTYYDVPQRNLTIRNTYMENIGRECMNWKSVLDGTGVLEYNYGVDCGGASGGSQNTGWNLNGTANWTIRGNRMYGTGGSGLKITWQNQDIAGILAVNGGRGVNRTLSPITSTTILIENNIWADVGLRTSVATNGFGIDMGGGDANSADVTVTIRHNTIAGYSTTEAVRCLGSGAYSHPHNLYHNVISDNTDPDGGGRAAYQNCSGVFTNNELDTEANMGFVNAGADNFELSSGSKNCNAVTNGTNSPTTDYEGEARPTGANRDRGADEGALCP